MASCNARGLGMNHQVNLSFPGLPQPGNSHHRLIHTDRTAGKRASTAVGTGSDSNHRDNCDAGSSQCPAEAMNTAAARPRRRHLGAASHRTSRNRSGLLTKQRSTGHEGTQDTQQSGSSFFHGIPSPVGCCSRSGFALPTLSSWSRWHCPRWRRDHCCRGTACGDRCRFARPDAALPSRRRGPGSYGDQAEGDVALRSASRFAVAPELLGHEHGREVNRPVFIQVYGDADRTLGCLDTGGQVHGLLPGVQIGDDPVLHFPGRFTRTCCW